MPEPRHFLDLEGAATIETHTFALSGHAIDLLARELAMGAIVGEAGLGKTFAVTAAVARQDDVDAVFLDCGVGWSSKSLIQELLAAITGVRHDADRLLLSAELAEVLGAKPRLIVLDEAQRLTYASIETLRSLHDRSETHFGLAFVGGHGCWDVLSRYPMLRSRIFVDVHFRRLTEEEITRDLPDYHPIYLGVEPELLLFVDEKFAHGVFRNWASFTKAAAIVCTDNGFLTVTEKVARNVFALHGSTRRG